LAEAGCVYLVGAGPGDPELLTVKAQRLLAEADAVVHDRLVAPGILDHCRADALKVFVGKDGGHHPVPQAEINAILARLAGEGRRVVRLKGGDPFIFGRGSEEAQYLAAQGIRFEIVPGITAAAGIGAALGLPLTHRGLATGVRLLTAHKRTDGEIAIDWTRTADPETTLVFYMGLENLAHIVGRLIESGLPADTPAAAISRGTTPDQRQCLSTLAALPADLEGLGFPTPVLIVVGRVAEVVRELNWRHLPLEGGKEPVHA
jgi:uroporphyrin-III C-methyltransferase/precorrin-2 dehydrogenase/sirohydrochlorin ferrochelatase/uroporphyrin-III C-methyltransferase